jgi:hypothetical protein
MKNIGGGVAPWNVNQYQVGHNGMGPTVDGRPIVFFHYHSLRTLYDRHLGFVAVQPAFGYEFHREMIRALFHPYVSRLRAMMKRATRAGFFLEADRVVNRTELLRGLAGGRYINAIWSALGA